MRKIESKLRKRIKDLEVQLDEVRNDRRKFRDHFQRRFRWWIELLGENKTAKISWLIEEDAKCLRSFSWWPW